MKTSFVVCSSILQKKIFFHVFFTSTFDAIQNTVIKLSAIRPCINTSQD
jgi:hypothetical protein